MKRDGKGKEKEEEEEGKRKKEDGVVGRVVHGRQLERGSSYTHCGCHSSMSLISINMQVSVQNESRMEGRCHGRALCRF